MRRRAQARADRLRQELLAAGAEPRDLTPAPGQAERMEAALARIVGQDPLERTAPVRVRRPVRRWFVLAAGAAAAAVAAVALPLVLGQTPRAAATTPELLTFDGTDSQVWPRTGTDARAVLAALAAHARSLPYRSDLPVQRLVVDSWSSTSGTDSSGRLATELVPFRDETLYSPDGRFRIIEKRGTALDQHGRIDEQIPWSSRPVTSDETDRSTDPGPGYAARLPTDPRRLHDRWASEHDPTSCAAFPGGCFLGDLTSLEHSYVVPPLVQSAVWTALAEEPSITFLGTTTDRAGRRAVAFGALSPDKVSQLVVLADPVTGAYLGDETVLIAPSAGYTFDPPAVTSFSAIVSAERIGAHRR